MTRIMVRECWVCRGGSFPTFASRTQPWVIFTLGPNRYRATGIFNPRFYALRMHCGGTVNRPCSRLDV